MAKGSEQPIWLMVAVLLALVIGIAMYQMVGKVRNPEAFETIQGDIDESQAKTVLDSLCMNWKGSNWASTPSNIGKATDYGAKLGWIAKDEWQEDAQFNKCDCAVYLYRVLQNIKKSDVYEITGVSKYSEMRANAMDGKRCHKYAACRFPYSLEAGVTLPIKSLDIAKWPVEGTEPYVCTE